MLHVMSKYSIYFYCTLICNEYILVLFFFHMRFRDSYIILCSCCVLFYNSSTNIAAHVQKWNRLVEVLNEPSLNSCFHHDFNTELGSASWFSVGSVGIAEMLLSRIGMFAV